MKISIKSFGGKKDNYYNFKRNFETACKHLSLCRVYLNNQMLIESIIWDAQKDLMCIEFENED